MFYCNPCGIDRKWPVNTLSRSMGKCELCDRHTECNDVRARDLPVSEPEWFKELPTAVRSSFLRSNVKRPDTLTVRELLRIPGIGPGSIRQLAVVIEKRCL